MGIGKSETEKAFEILREGINEVIATTYENTAPMGVIRHGSRLHMAVYLTSHTAQNIQKYPWVVLHITDDTRWFVKTAFSDPDTEEYVSETWDGISIQRLKELGSWIACTCTIENITAQQVLVSLTPIHVAQSSHVFHPVNRGYNSVIEATVHATRYVHTKDPMLGDLITFHIGVAKKCGDSTVKEAIHLLLSYLKMHDCDI
jgi:hypothetical protein